jgi:uncharacterized protein
MMVNKKKLTIEQKNNYPWDGKLAFHVTPQATQSFNLLVRIPGWARNEAMPSDLYTFTESSDKKVTITVNGKAIDYQVQKGYASINRSWKKGDIVVVDLPMDVRRVESNKKVVDNIGKISLQRGPLMYCAEWPDNFGKAGNLVLTSGTTFNTEFKTDLLNGITLIKSEATAIKVDEKSNTVSTVKQPFTAIPYYAWAHRGKGEMMMWFPVRVTDVDIISK